MGFMIFPIGNGRSCGYTYSGLMQRVDSLEKTLMLGGIGGRRRRGRQRMRGLDATPPSPASGTRVLPAQQP